MERDCNMIETFLGMPSDRRCNHLREGVQTTHIHGNVF